MKEKVENVEIEIQADVDGIIERSLNRSGSMEIVSDVETEDSSADPIDDREVQSRDEELKNANEHQPKKCGKKGTADATEEFGEHRSQNTHNASNHTGQGESIFYDVGGAYIFRRIVSDERSKNDTEWYKNHVVSHQRDEGIVAFNSDDDSDDRNDESEDNECHHARLIADFGHMVGDVRRSPEPPCNDNANEKEKRPEAHGIGPTSFKDTCVHLHRSPHSLG